MKSLIFPIFFLAGFALKASDPFPYTVSAYAFANWAYCQHFRISSMIHPLILSGRILPLDNSGREISKKEALRLFEDIDYSNWPDTFYVPIASIYYSHDFYSISLDSLFAYIKPYKRSEPVKFRKKEFMALLDTEQKLYLRHYQIQGQLLTDSIPYSSLRFIRDINIHLFKAYLEPSTSMYHFNWREKKLVNDTLHTPRFEVVEFISTDKEDVTIGRDTVFQVIPSLDDSLGFKSLVFLLDMNAVKINIQAVSCGLHRLQNNKTASDAHPCAYLSYKSASQLAEDKFSLLEYCLGYSLLCKMNNDDYNYINSIFAQRFNENSFIGKK